MNRTTIGALTLALGLSLVPRAVAQSVHLERVPGVFRDLARAPGTLTLPLEGDEEGLSSAMAASLVRRPQLIPPCSSCRHVMGQFGIRNTGVVNGTVLR